MKKKILLSLLAIACPIALSAITLGEAMAKHGDTRTEYKRRVTECKYYIIGVAHTEKEISGRVSNMIQKGIDLIESGKGRYSDLCGIMDAHRQILSLQASIKSNRLLEIQRESFWIKEAQKIHGGNIEVILEDGSRVDLLTDTHAIEVEKASNWKESIGQSLHYAHLTNKKAGIILLAEVGDTNSIIILKYIRSLNEVIDAYDLPIDILMTTK